MVAQPGKTFSYCTGATHLLSAVLQQATGMSVREFANRSLFGPLGIAPIQEDRWWSDAQGVSRGGYGLSLTPQEMAKLGFLYLNQGQWDGQPVVPADWVLTSTASHSDLGDKKEYGYLWWTDPGKKWYAALGRAGQHIFVYPAENLVVVSTADLPYTNDADLLPIQELLDRFILPAIKSDHSLPANPDGVARLQASIQALSQSQTMSPQPLPAIASQVLGKIYIFDENPLGWETIIFTFEQGVDEAKATVNGARQVRIGLDNEYRFLALDNTPFPQGTRGRWESPDTLLVESINLGQMGRSTSRVQFAGDTVHITFENSSSGSHVDLQGTLEPVPQ